MSGWTHSVLLPLLGAVAASCAKDNASPSKAEQNVSVSAPRVGESPDQGKGTIEGKVTFAGQAPAAAAIPRTDPACTQELGAPEVLVHGDHRLEDALVQIAPGPLAGRYNGTGQVVRVDQKQCAYQPRIQGGLVGATVEVHNGDPTMHNVHTYRNGQTVLNRAQPTGAPPLRQEKLTSETGVLKLKCDVHPWMSGFVVVSDNPFYATTGADGTFRLADVPAGSYTVQAYHPKLGIKKATVTVVKDQVIQTELAYAEGDKSE